MTPATPRARYRTAYGLFRQALAATRGGHPAPSEAGTCLAGAPHAVLVAAALAAGLRSEARFTLDRARTAPDFRETDRRGDAGRAWARVNHDRLSLARRGRPTRRRANMAEFHIAITGGTEQWDGSLVPLIAEDLDRAVAAVRAVLAPLPQREAEIMRAAHEAEMTAHLPGGHSVDRDAAERWRDIQDAAELAAHRAATRGRPDAAAVAVYVGIRSTSC